MGASLPPELSYWRELGARYLALVCTQPEASLLDAETLKPLAAHDDLAALAQAAPLMIGAEFGECAHLRAAESSARVVAIGRYRRRRS